MAVKVIFGAICSVAEFNRKIVTFLVAAALGSASLGICPAHLLADEPAKPSFEDSGSLFAKDPNFLSKSQDSPGIGNLFFRAMFAVLIVVALGAAAIYISKRYLSRITNLPGKKIHIIETVHLGPRKAVHLLKIGNQQLLIGSTNESITKLTDVIEGFSEMDLSATEIDNN